MGFLLNRNRINVAVSRTQWKAILIRSALTAFMPTSAHGVLELGAFNGLCASSES
jgi:superfamily I DNA and/or RNA helicase